MFKRMVSLTPCERWDDILAKRAASKGALKATRDESEAGLPGDTRVPSGNTDLLEATSEEVRRGRREATKGFSAALAKDGISRVAFVAMFGRATDSEGGKGVVVTGGK